MASRFRIAVALLATLLVVDASAQKLRLRITSTSAVRTTYTTSFPATENPISQSGNWTNGGANGLTDCRTTPGLIFNTMTGASVPPYVDSTCLLTGIWGQVQSSEATIVRTGTPANYQEVELRLLTNFSGSNSTGYEVLFSVTTFGPYVQIVKWLGTSTGSGNFVYVDNQNGTALVTGNRIKATVDINGLITAYEDIGSGYVQVAQGTDTTWRHGNPGIGLWNNSAGAPGTNADFGLSYFTTTTSGSP